MEDSGMHTYYELTPVNGSLIAEVISDDEFLSQALGIDPKAPVQTAGGIHLITDQDNDAQAMIVYAKGRVLQLDTDNPPIKVKAGDIIVYNIGAVVERDRLTAKKKVIVHYPNVIVVYSKKITDAEIPYPTN